MINFPSPYLNGQSSDKRVNPSIQFQFVLLVFSCPTAANYPRSCSVAGTSGTNSAFIESPVQLKESPINLQLHGGRQHKAAVDATCVSGTVCRKRIVGAASDVSRRTATETAGRATSIFAHTNAARIRSRLRSRDREAGEQGTRRGPESAGFPSSVPCHWVKPRASGHPLVANARATQRVDLSVRAESCPARSRGLRNGGRAPNERVAQRD